jgi:hypothetical protein
MKVPKSGGKGRDKGDETDVEAMIKAMRLM